MRRYLLLLGVLACGGQAASPVSAPVGEAFTGPWAPAPRTKDDDVVAEVGEQKIYVSDVERLARAAQLTARQATDDLIGQALLADEARRRGLLEDPEVIAATRDARARVFIDREFASKFAGPEDVPRADVDKAWTDPRVRYHFNHPEVRVVHYFRFKPGDDGPAGWAAAKAGIEALAARCASAPPASVDAFLELGDQVRQELKLPAEQAGTWTTRRGQTVPEFADAAFSIPAAGQISKPFKTKWGWDLIFLKQIEPPLQLDEDHAAAQIRSKIFEVSRSRAFTAWVDALVAKHRVTRHDERLDAVTVDSPLSLLPQAEAAAPPSP
jgi:peptidyl-prolyl cis-trans isomerase C